MLDLGKETDDSTLPRPAIFLPAYLLFLIRFLDYKHLFTRLEALGSRGSLFGKAPAPAGHVSVIGGAFALPDFSKVMDFLY